MKFWDTSAIAALVVDEPATPAMRELVAADPDVLVWVSSSVEMLSVLGRLGRQSAELAICCPARGSTSSICSATGQRSRTSTA